MGLSCTIVAGLLCFHATFGAQPTISYRGDDIHARGQGWALSYYPARGGFEGFSSAKASRVCAAKTCLLFRRVCGQIGGKPDCRYFLDELGMIEFYADKAAWQEAAPHIAIYRPGQGRQSDFPLSLLDRAAGPGK